MNLNKAVLETKWDEWRRKVFDWRNKLHNDQLSKVDSVRERSISILQRRYGYTREQATYQLDEYYPRAWLG
jgi:DNA replication initiation complex subunit (GINS family)